MRRTWTLALVLLILLVAVLVTGCTSTSQVLEPGTFYRRDIGIEVNGVQYQGVVTVPHAKSYDFVFQPKGDVDLLLIKNCHRTFSAEKLSPGWFGKNKFPYSYTPFPEEDDRVCPVRVEVYESAKEGKHSWAFLDFENPKYALQYILTCDGNQRIINGVGVCQAKSDTAQWVRFNEPIRFAPALPEKCSKPEKKDGFFEIKTSVGECLYHFDTRDGRKGRLTVIGFQGVLVREPQ